MKAQPSTSTEEYVAEQERLYAKRNFAIAQQMMRDAKPLQITGKGLVKFFGKCLLGFGFVVLLLEVELVLSWMGQFADALQAFFSR